MVYPYISLPDGTEIVHTDIIEKEDGPHVEVNFERPKHLGFDTARCDLPTYTWIVRDGFTDEEMKLFGEFMVHNAHLLFKYARAGGVQIA